MEAPTRRDDVVDVVHGVEVADPYRWLEDGDSPETVAWVAEQNERTRLALDAPPDRARWHERLVALLDAPVSAGCRLAGDRVFTLERGAGRGQFALFVRSLSDPAAAPRLVLDPSSMAADGTAAIDWYHPSPDGRLVAYGVSEGGDERSVLRIVDAESGAHLPDEIPDTRAASVGWWADGRGFAYTRYPAGDEYHRMVYGHTLGAAWADDALLWGDLHRPEAWPDVSVSDDGRYVLVHVMIDWAHVNVHLLDVAAGEWRTVVSGADATSSFSVDGDRLVGHTTLDAPRGRVVTAPCATPGVDAWSTLVAESDVIVGAVAPCAGELLVASTQHAVSRLTRHDALGGALGEVALPHLGSLAGLDASPTSSTAVVQVESFTRPASLFRWTAADGLVPWPAGGAGLVADAPVVDADAFAVTQVRYPSLDGTEIGLFLVHRADVVPGPDTPCILTGYGGFAIANSPAWSPLAATWCEQGGLFAVAGLRGGYEEGEAWHHAGRRQTKQNVFDDFAAAADYLVATGRTSRARLGLRGGSNGGLLVGVALTQRPDLARAVLCAVPLLDMVRYPRFLIARLWTEEYGDPDVAEEFAWLWAYSPYHHVVDGVCYPAVLFTAAEGDGRVDPLHARKMTAALQHASSCGADHPILLRQESRAGHGVGKPAAKQADELADVLAFLSWQFDLASVQAAG